MTTTTSETHVRPVPSLTALWDRGLSLALLVAGLVMLLVGWKLVSDTPFPAEQLPYMISAGIGGLAVLGIGATLWLSADLRDEWHKLDRIDSRLERIEASLADEAQP
ncbi:MAG: hypothetical protein JWO12_1917 [Frankiales bacterium]|jgi:hypothetical protein|nr:hypothetical protein [Frankiales bacterium]